MINSSIVIINVVSKSCLHPPGCTETSFVMLDFVCCLLHIKRSRNCEQRNVSPVDPLMSAQDKISVHSNRTVWFISFPYKMFSVHSCFHLVLPSGTCIFLNQAVVRVVLNYLSSVSLTNQMMEVQGVVR